MGADLKIGAELAGHRIEAVIGHGGASVVYLAEHLRLGRKVALKVLDPEIADEPAFRERFVRECRIAAGLDHSNIVTVYDAGEAGGTLYISMRPVDGSDLERALGSEGSLDADRTISLIGQCAAALDAAHAEGLVHRDVKPANILLASDPDGRDHVYLADFGITKRKRSDVGLTRTGQFVGTVDYVAPEQIRGESIDGRADVYSLGCVLYRCLTGEVPFPRDTEIGTIYGHLEDAPPAPTARAPALPTAIDPVIARALAKSRDERFPTCGELAGAAAEALGLQAAPPERASARPVVGPPRTGRVPRHERRGRRRRAILVIASLSAVAVVASSILLLGRPDHRKPAESATAPAPVRLLHWNAVHPLDPLLFGGAGDQDISGAVTFDGMVVAVGRDDSGGNRHAAVWYSQNLVGWTKAHDTALRAPGAEQISGIAVFRSKLVAVGSETLEGHTDPAVWISAGDPGTWERVPGDPSGLHRTGVEGRMRRVIVTEGHLVAVGSTTTPEGLNPAIWISTDAEHWDEVALDRGASWDAEAFGVAELNGQIFVVGDRTNADGSRDGAIWRGSGDSWSPIDDQDLGGAGDQQITAVVAGGPGLVAVGSSIVGGVRHAAAWYSADGQDWTRARVTGSGSTGEGDQQMLAVERVGENLVAGGMADAPQDGADAAVWISSDGESWQRENPSTRATFALGGDGEQQIKSLVVLGDRLVAVGSESRAADQQAEVWFAHIPPGF